MLNTMDADDSLSRTPRKPGLMDNEGEKPPSPVRVEEKLTRPERRSVGYPDVLFLGTDNVDLMGPDLARSVLKKSFLLEIEAVELASDKVRVAYGQVGFFRGDDSDDPNTPKNSITALHNVVLEQEEYEFIAARTQVRGDFYILRFPDCRKVSADVKPYPLRLSSESSPRNDKWRSGIDVTAGSVPSVITAEQGFKQVRGDFVLEKGQKIGIVVTMPPQDVLHSSLRKEYPHLDLQKLDGIFGITDDRFANVYTGEITYVGEKHIEYDANSFDGCSGAIVFLLDKNQPESVMEIDCGCAVAVHAGAHPYYDRNLGFIIPGILAHRSGD